MSKINRYFFFAISFLFLAVFLSCSLVLARQTLMDKLRERWLEKKRRTSDNRESGDYQLTSHTILLTIT